MSPFESNTLLGRTRGQVASTSLGTSHTTPDYLFQHCRRKAFGLTTCLSSVGRVTRLGFLHRPMRVSWRPLATTFMTRVSPRSLPTLSFATVVIGAMGHTKAHLRVAVAMTLRVVVTAGQQSLECALILTSLSPRSCTEPRILSSVTAGAASST